MGSKPKGDPGPQGAAAYTARAQMLGLSSVMADVQKSVALRGKRTSGKVKSAVSKTKDEKARSY